MNDSARRLRRLAVAGPLKQPRRPRGAKPSKSAPYMSVGLYLAGLDIISIDTRPETPAEPSRTPVNDGITSRSTSYRAREPPSWGGSKPSESAPHTSLGLQLTGLDIRSI